MASSDVEELRDKLEVLKLRFALEVGLFLEDIFIPCLLLVISGVLGDYFSPTPMVIYSLGASTENGVAMTSIMEAGAIAWIFKSAIVRMVTVTR